MNTNRQTIKIPSKISGKTVNYLSDFISELPKNKIVNKGGTGVGGTTLAIRDKNPYVIAVPFQEMIINKCFKEKNLLGVMQGITTEDIKEYLNNSDIPKIMVTYDSLPRVIECINPKEFNILIDEMHVLFTSYSYRRDAAMNVLHNFKKFKSYTFLSATIMDEKYRLKELRGIDVIDYEWENKTITKISSIYCPNVIKSAINIIENHTGCQNLYFFTNSIQSINAIVKTCGLNDDNARMICSKHNTSKTELIKSNTLSDPKRFNFLTSSVFEGADLYDENGVILVLSEGNKSHTLLDISSSIIQIAGRIRDSRYSNKIFHLYSTSRYNGITKSEFDDICKEDVKKSYFYESDYAKLSPETIEITNSDGRYMNKIDGKLIFDENALLLDQFNFDVHNDYQLTQRLVNKFKENELEVTNYFDKVHEIIIQTPNVISFKDRVKKIKEYDDKINYDISHDVFKELTFKKYPWLKDAIDKLGFAKIASLDYSQYKIKANLIEETKVDSSVRLLKMMKFKNNEFYTTDAVKQIIQNAYDLSGIKKKAKTSDINIYYDVVPQRIMMNDKKVSGVKIIRKKVLIE